VLGLVQGSLFEIEPSMTLPGEFALRAPKPDSSGRGRLYLSLDGRTLELGRTFFVMAKTGEVQLDGVSGLYRLGKKSQARFRCVFGGQHLEITVKRT
jgi:hypothetical protein